MKLRAERKVALMRIVSTAVRGAFDAGLGGGGSAREVNRAGGLERRGRGESLQPVLRAGWGFGPLL
jgi:hypothetical protein